MTTDTTAHVSELTAGEMLYTLNGFDEIAIATRFGKTLADLRSEASALTLGRALIFVQYRRDGLKDAAAWEASMELTIDAVTNYFKPDPKAKKKKAKKKGKVCIKTNGKVCPTHGVEHARSDGGAPVDAEGNQP